MLIYHF